MPVVNARRHDKEAFEGLVMPATPLIGLPEILSARQRRNVDRRGCIYLNMPVVIEKPSVLSILYPFHPLNRLF